MTKDDTIKITKAAERIAKAEETKATLVSLTESVNIEAAFRIELNAVKSVHDTYGRAIYDAESAVVRELTKIGLISAVNDAVKQCAADIEEARQEIAAIVNGVHLP